MKEGFVRHFLLSLVSFRTCMDVGFGRKVIDDEKEVNGLYIYITVHAEWNPLYIGIGIWIASLEGNAWRVIDVESRIIKHATQMSSHVGCAYSGMESQFMRNRFSISQKWAYHYRWMFPCTIVNSTAYNVDLIISITFWAFFPPSRLNILKFSWVVQTRPTWTTCKWT